MVYLLKETEVLFMNPKYLDDFLIYLSTIQGKSENTIPEYEYDISLFLKYILLKKKETPLDEIEKIDISNMPIDLVRSVSLEDLHDFLYYCQTKRNNGPHARARKVAAMRSFYKYLTNKKKYFDDNPTLELESPKIGKRNPVYLTMDEIRLLYTGIEGIHYYRDVLIITLFLNTGLRVSELSNINIDSIKDDILTVVGKGDKERTVYLNKMTLKTLNDYIELERKKISGHENEAALILSQKGNRISRKTVYAIIQKANERSGLYKKKLSPHKLRHTMATILHQNGVDIVSIQELLGHTSISTTQIYTHVNKGELRDAVKFSPTNNEELLK